MAHVLIVDDEQDIRDTLRFILEDAGYDVLEASDGEVALALLRESTVPLVVLLDLLLPKVSGVEILKAAIADPRLTGQHAYLLMTADSAVLRHEADPLLAQVSAQVITKPFDVDNLLTMIDRVSRFSA